MSSKEHKFQQGAFKEKQDGKGELNQFPKFIQTSLDNKLFLKNQDSPPKCCTVRTGVTVGERGWTTAHSWGGYFALTGATTQSHSCSKHIGAEKTPPFSPGQKKERSREKEALGTADNFFLKVCRSMTLKKALPATATQ